MGPHDGYPGFVSEADRSKWNARHAAGGGPQAPSAWLVEHVALLPAGRALEVACGVGGNAVFLAQAGWDVTAIDVSDVALARTLEVAAAARVSVRVERRDLPDDGLPEGPWDVITCAWFLERPLSPLFAASLAPGGALVLEVPTTRHAERTGFSRAYCVEPGELRRAFPGLETLAHREGGPEGEVEALVARRPR